MFFIDMTQFAFRLTPRTGLLYMQSSDDFSTQICRETNSANPVISKIVNRLINSLLNNLVFEAFSFSSVEFSLSCKGVVWVFLSTEPSHPSHLSCSGHQGSQSAQVVGGSGEGKQPPHLVDSSQLHFL